MLILTLFAKKIVMNFILTIIIMNYIIGSPIANTTSSGDKDDMMIMFWNLENFFDYKDSGTGKSDKEFSARGSRYWTKAKFNNKCRAIAKSILWIADKEGRVPDLIGVAEIENRFVLQKLIENTALRKMDYDIVHYDSPDHRGIDVGLLYRKETMQLISSKSCRVSGYSEKFPHDSLRTRDILLVKLKILNKSENDRMSVINILVNHHPSKFGGPDTKWKREAAIKLLREITDSLFAAGEESIIVTGDFNDTPENRLFQRLCSNISVNKWGSSGTLINKALQLSDMGMGSIRFNGKWELIDMFFVSEIHKNSEMKVISLPFLMIWDNIHPGLKPLRTYSGPKYLGGVSDHLPIILKIKDPLM